MREISRMDYGELVRLHEALGDILAARRLEAEYDLEGFETSALELLNEAAGDALEAWEQADAAYERREYEKNVL